MINEILRIWNRVKYLVAFIVFVASIMFFYELEYPVGKTAMISVVMSSFALISTALFLLDFVKIKVKSNRG